MLTISQGTVRTVGTGSVQVLEIKGRFVRLAVFSDGAVEENVRDRVLSGEPQPCSHYLRSKQYPADWPRHPESDKPACGWTWRIVDDWVNIDGVKLTVQSVGDDSVELSSESVPIEELCPAASDKVA